MVRHRRPRLTDRDLDPLLVRRAARRILVGPGAYLLAIGLSFVSTAASIAIYALVPLLYILPGRVDRHLRAHDAPADATTSAHHAIVPGDGEDRQVVGALTRQAWRCRRSRLVRHGGRRRTT